MQPPARLRLSKAFSIEANRLHVLEFAEASL